MRVLLGFANFMHKFVTVFEIFLLFDNFVPAIIILYVKASVIGGHASQIDFGRYEDPIKETET